ncbi:dystonin-like protein short stop isoform X7 [Rhodnius prolixus]|uniref:dystonin-like protein short stop isoform X7 n=1 Tax=Rhodnius prolixus TaxID=13249 RepID=UPI003D18E9D4
MDFENDFSLKEWAKDKPLSILQLDPADRAVLRIADERDAIQKKTFTKWVNKHLKKHWICSKANRHVTDLFTDLQDGLNLISLLEVLSGEHLHREKGRMRFHCLQNVELVLNFLRYKKIKLVNIRPEDIVDGNPKLTLGLIWTIILHYQISDIVVGEEANVVSAKDVLLRWARKSTAKYPGVKVQDFTSSWRDGLAFNAIIHRNRPDLLDWRQIKSRTVRERLETAFYTAEKVGVTRLLDPEDVDTHEPDEKSIITYISSMYDVFPEPPAAHPLYDNESQAITTEYREIASSLHLWLREKTSIMSDRTMPASYTELKRLSQESTRFKTEEIPSKQRDKQRLQHLYRDLQKLYESTGEVEIEPELHIEILERNWTKLITLHQERDQLIQDELKKSERLDRLAERVSRDSKRIDSRLDDVESRLNEEARRLERLHPLDAKRNAETLETEMRSIEDSIQSLFHDTATLKSAGHHAAHDLHKKVTKLHQKWVTLRSALHQKLFARLATMSFPVVEERTVTRQTRTVLETRLVDTNHHFRSLQQAIEWCKTKLKMLHESEFGNDLPGVKIELSHHQREHKEIDRFQSTVDQCANAKNQFQGEEQTLYLQHLNTLHKIYSELLTTSNKRLADLESLQDLLQSVQNQLSWLEDKINVEIVRDFSDLDMNLTAVHQYHEALMSELEKREVSVRSVIERGNSLSLQGHPAASKVIHKWTETLKETWSRLLQFSLACEIHTAAMRKCQEFNRDLREAEAWLQSRDELLNTVYSASEFSLDEGERLLKGMQELREELNKKAPVFAELAARAPDIAPMRQRRLPVTRPMQVTAVCNYTNENVYIEKEDPWVLHDNSALTQWRVSSLGSRPPAGDTNVPGVVFAIPPPSRDALDGAERLNRSFERTTALWQRKQTRLRQNMIFATIRVVRSWDLPQFVGMGSEQRTAIRRALNEDADKLLSEGDPTDPQLRRLRREMEEVNRLFEEFERRARQEDENKTALREFTEQINTLQSSLDEAERTLNMRIVSSIPRDVHSLEHLVIQHKDFETDLKVLTPQVENIQTSFNILPRKSAALQNRLDAVLSQWNMLWNYSHLYIERLKCIEIILASLDEASNVVSELELKLASFGDMPSELEPLQNVHDDLIRLQNAIAARQPVVDQLIDEAKNTRRVVVRSRDRSSERDHSDLDRLDDEVNSVTQRWNELCAQLVDRLRSCEAAYSLLDNYGKTYQTEVKFIDEAYTQLNNLPPVSHAKHHIEPTKVLFTSIVERTQPLEQVNIDGGRFIREAKIYQLKLRKYRDQVARNQPSYDPGSPIVPDMEEEEKVAAQLDTLNQRFSALVSVMQDRLRQIAALTSDKDLEAYVSKLKPVCLKTFRTEFSLSDTSKIIPKKWTHTEEATTQVEMGNQINGRNREATGIGTEVINSVGIRDPVTGINLTVAEAIRRRLLDVRTGTVNTPQGPLSLEEAVRAGHLDPELANKLLGPVPGGGSLLEAIQREIYAAEGIWVSQHKYCLYDSLGLGIVGRDLSVLNRGTGVWLPLREAVKLNLIDADTPEIFTECEKITLREALDRNLPIDPSAVQRPLTLKDALDLGMLKGNNVHTPIGIFSIEEAMNKRVLDGINYNCITDPDTGHLVNLQTALRKSIIVPNGYRSSDGDLDFNAASDAGFLSTVAINSVFDIGLLRVGEDFKSLNVLIDNANFDRGSFKFDKEYLSLEEAQEQGLIRTEVKDIMKKKIGVKSSGKELDAFEAVSMGLLDTKTGLLIDKKGRRLGFEEALKKKLITREGLSVLKSILAITLTTQTKTVRRWVTEEGLKGTEEIEDPVRRFVSEEVKVIERTTKPSGVKEGLKKALDAISMKKKPEDIPHEGWPLREAIEKGVFDPKRGLFQVPGTDREVSFEECLRLGIINPDSGKVIEQKREMGFLRALDKKIMDATGKVRGIPMEEAINSGIIILDDVSPDPLQVAQGVIFDPSSSLVILTESGESVRFTEALRDGKLDRDKVRVNGMTLDEAINAGILSEDLTRFAGEDGKGMPVTEALRKGIVSVEGKPLVRSNKILGTIGAVGLAVAASPIIVGKAIVNSFKKPEDDKKVEITKHLGTKELALRGAYDPKTGRFLASGKQVLFVEVAPKLFDMESTLVKDIRTDEYIPLKEAIGEIVDPNDGSMIDPRTERNVPFFQAVKIGWITSKKKARKKPHLTLREAVTSKILDPQTVRVKYEDETTTLHGAILDGILDPSEIRVWEDKGYVPLEYAVSAGLVDLNTGAYAQTNLSDGFRDGLVRPKNPPVSIEPLICKNLYNSEDGKVLDLITEANIDVSEAVNACIVDGDISKVKHNNEWMSVNNAIKEGIIEGGKLNGKDLRQLLDEGNLKTEVEPKSLIELITEEYYNPKTGLVLDPRKDEIITLKQCLDTGFANPNRTKIRDPKNDALLTINEASEELLDLEKGILTYPYKMTLDVAYSKGYLLPTQPPMTLPEAVMQGLIDNGLILPGKTLGIKRSLEGGLLVDSPCLVHDSGLITPLEAIDGGAMDAQSGDFRGMPLDKALIGGFLVPQKSFTVKEAVSTGVYSPKTGLFSGGITTNAAIQSGLLDPDTTIIRTTDGPESFKDSADKETGRIATQKGELDFSEAFRKGVIADLPRPAGIVQACEELLTGIGLFLDPRTGSYLTLDEAVKEQLIDGINTLVDTPQGTITLQEALKRKVVDPNSGTVQGLPLKDALGTVILDKTNKDTGLPLQTILKSGLYSPITGKVLVSGKETTLNRAIREGHIDPDQLLCPSADNKKLVTLREAILDSIVDPRSGKFIHEQVALPLDTALDLNLIKDLNKIGLYEAVQTGLLEKPEDLGKVNVNPMVSRIKNIEGKYVNLKEAKRLQIIPENLPLAVKEGVIVPSNPDLDLETVLESGLKTDTGFVNPVENTVLSLEKSLDSGFINPKTTLVKTKPLDQAVKEKLVDFNGIKDGGEMIPLEECFEKGILRSVKEPLATKCARLKVPITGRCTLGEAIRTGFLEPKSSSVKTERGALNLARALDEKSIDSETEGILDTTDGITFTLADGTKIIQGTAMSFAQALSSNLLDPDCGMMKHNNKKYTLREAINAGLLDPNTIIIKDTSRRRFVKFPEAIKKGISDERGNTLDRANSKLYNIRTGLDSEILYTGKISLLDALDYGVYNPTSGLFTDPFSEGGLSRRRLDLNSALGCGLLGPDSAVVKDKSGDIKSLTAAIGSGILDPEKGRLREDGQELDLIKAKDKGYIIRAESRQAMEEKYKLCDDGLRQLLEWIGDLEVRLANQEPAKEHLDGIRNQINLLKLIKEELESQQRVIQSCLDDVRTVVSTGAEFLTRDEVSGLERNSKSLKNRVDKANTSTDKMLHRIISAAEELHKFRSETTIFTEWLEKTKRIVTEKERTMSLQRNDGSVSELLGDVISHQADLRFITMAGQKFTDESKEFLNAVNEYRSTLSSRPGPVDALQGNELRGLVSELNKQYKELLAKLTGISEKLSQLGSKEVEYTQALERLREWMRVAAPNANKIISEPLAADPHSLEEQLNRTKVTNTDFISQGRLVDNLRQALESLLRSVEGTASRTEINELTSPVNDLTNRYESLCTSLQQRVSILENALSQSQGVEDAIDSVVGWLSTAENNFKAISRPASLVKERLDEQVRELRLLLSDVSNRRGSLETVVSQAKSLVAQATNPRLAKRIDTKLKDILSRYEKLSERASKRSELLTEVTAGLDEFSGRATELERWLQESLESLETGASGENLNHEKELRTESYERTLRDGRTLLAKKDVTDTSQVRDRIKNIETQWRELSAILDERVRLAKLRAEQSLAYEKLREQVLSWLNGFENRVSRLEPIALNIDVIKKQMDELKPLVKEHREYAPTIDKLFDLGNSLAAFDRPESPTRRRTSVSPVKRLSTTIGRRTSIEITSPSPTKSLYTSVTSPLSPGSSGFGSRRSSQDAFHLEGQFHDLTGVQQELADINNRYSALGVRLSDRNSELESVRVELKKWLDHLRSLDQFLDRIQRSLPAPSLPPNKETADKMNVVVKGLLEEMYEKHSALESTKIGVTELLKKKPQAPGSDVLQQQLNEVTSKWKSVNDACKNRIQLLEDLKDLYDTHDHLSAWLSSKERMLSALGPISPDPRMAGSQQEQVRVLREELRATLPQLTHLRDVSQTVLARAKSWTQLETRLKDINDRWDSLLKKLDQREDSLGAAMDSSKQLQLGLATLKNTLDNISDEIDSEKSEKQVEAKLKKIQGCERQLEGARQLLAEVESAGEQLCLVLTDQASRADIQSKLSDVNRQYTTLQAKLDQRKAEIEALLRDGREFDATVAKTLGWLNEELGSLSDRLMISADRDILQQQVDMHEAIYKEVIGKEHQVIMVLDKGNMLKTSSRNLDNLRALWEKLRKEAVDRQTRLQTSMDHCRKYYKSLENFIPWLSQAENKLDSLRPDSFTRRDLDKHLRDLASFRNDVWKKSGEFEHIKSLSETFVSSCDIHKEIVLQEVASVKSRWDKLNNELLHKTSSLEELGRRLADATDRLRSLSHSVQRCEDRLGSHDSLATHTDPATLHRLSALRDEVVALRKPLESLCTVCSDLDAEVAHFSPGRTSGLSEDVAAISERLDDLSARLDDRCDRANSAAKEVQRYNDKVKQLTVDLTSLEEELDGMKPPGRDVKTLRGQQDQLSAFNTKVNRAADDVSVMMSLADSLVDSGFSPDATRQQAENVSKRLALLEEGSRAREEALESALDKLAEFEDRAREASNLVDRAMEEVRRLKPVGSEVETIRSQQAESSRVRADFVEPAGLSVERALNLGQALVQSAAPGVGTQQLERDQEKLADKWNNLKEKMNERDRKLDVGLLQSGKFQEALEGLSKWLSDTEEMVANQRPPSADYKVVKAQLQEQKFLKKMLLDRQGSMSSLVAMGREVAADCDASERAGIERSLRSLADRFDDLTEKAETRMRALEQAMGVAKLFQDKLNPVVDWLDKTEKKIKDMELVPTDEEKIQEKIREHHATHEEILRKKPALAELTEIASELMSLVGEDEACAVADKVQEVADRYSALAVTSDGVGSLLERSRTGLRHLVLTYQQLQGWMEGMEQRLSKYKVLAVHTDQLLAQMEDLADLTEEISNHQTDVDSTVDTGLELMRNISSDEAIQLKDKLDSLQRRYNELTTRGADLLKQTQEALPLVQQFHNAHYRLADWMHGAETTLQNDPREDSIHTLEMDIQEFRPVLENVNQLGPQLCAIGPGEGSATIEGLVTRDNRRFDAIAEQVQRKAERLHLSKQRSLEVLGDVDSLLEWFREVEAQLREAEPPSAEPNVIRLQLKEHKALNDDIASQKGRVRDVLDTAKKVLRESPQYEDNSVMRDKMSDLRETMDSVWTASGVRLGLLEQALGLSSHFEESHCELVSWLGETEQQVRSLPPPALRPQAIAQQEDRTEMLLQSISEHKPLVDKLNKTGEALIKLVAYDEGAKLQEMLDSDNSRYDSLRASLKARQEALEKAMQESSQFSDKLEGMLRALGNTADEVNSVEPVAAHPPKIRQQMKENQAFVDEVAKREEAFEAVKKAAIDVIAKSPSDPAVRDVKKKLDKLQQLWTEINDITKTRNKSLSEALEVAARFWSQLESVMGSLSQIEASLVAQEPPALRPDAIKRQEEALDEIKTEIDQTKPRVDEVRKTGASLMALCGEPDKPEVRKHIEDLDTAWDTVTSLFAKREENLLHAMDRAMEFHDSLRTLKEFLSGAEQKFSSLGPLGTEIEVVKKQLAEMKEFKAEVDPMMVKVEALNRQAAELTERSSVEQAQGLKDSLSAVNTRWDELHRGIAERNRQLENALLRLGHFQHALSELLAWIQATEGTLDSEIGEIVLDPRLMQIQLAKLKVLMNDMTAHQTSVDTLNDAGRQLIEAGRGNASTIQTDLDSLNRQWTRVLEKAANKQADLEQALSDVHRFTTEIQDAVSWLGEVDAVIASSKPVGGLAETAQEQLDRFMVVYDELESSRPRVEGILSRGHEYLRRSPATSGSDAPSHLQTSLKTLKTRWDSVTARANDKKIKLEIALKEATEFHEALQSFVNWLTSAEKTLSNLKPVSRVLETILGQIEEHKAFQKEVGVHRETMIQLDKKGTHLKYFSQKQDVILIKNLLISVQHRWERVVSKSAERTRALDHGYKEAKDFHDSWSALTTWLQETDKKLDEISAEINSAANDPQKLKQRLAKHRETQKAIAAKQPTYDATVRAGKQLRERSPKQDEPHLKAMITQLKELWITVCNKAVDRQRKLEEALLYCGQVKDALDALLDWLRKVHKELAEDGPVHGDLDTVQALIEQHKALEQELQNRHPQVESVEKSGHELASKSDGHNMSDQVSEMTDLWRKTNSLAQKRGVKLQEALKQAEELHKSVHMLLEWLSDAEMRLRFVDNLPDDETDTRIQISEHEKFMREMRDKEREKDSTVRLAEEILAKAHPDGGAVVKHWITIIQSRWEEVTSWAKQREERLRAHLRALQEMDTLLEELLSWLGNNEGTLIALEHQELPNSIPPTEVLITEHQEFMESMAKRTTEVDTVIKAKQIKERKVSKKTSKEETRTSTQELSDLSRRQSLKSSREHLGTLDRKGSRTSPGRDVGDLGLPHIGPKFPAKGSKIPEPQFKCARSRLLYDRWRSVWLMSWERQRRLRDHLNHLAELERLANFSWDEWRKRFLKFMNHKKSRLTDLFRKMDKNNDGLIPRDDFIEGVIKTKFDTSRLEMGAVADMFDHNSEGYIDWKEFIAALRPDWEERKPVTEAEKIHDEVKRLVMLCTCRQKFRVFQVGEGKYRFGDSQKLRLVRILRSTVMVRVGGGWVALEEFLIKNDPCRVEMLPIPNPFVPEEHEAWCPLARKRSTGELLSELMPIFESLREREREAQRSFPITLAQRIHSSSTPHTCQIREKSARSVPMGGDSRGSDTPDYLTPRKSSRSALTPGGSLPGSRTNSRPASRQGSKPPSRHGSSLSLASSEEGTPSRIPRRSVPSRTNSTASSAQRKLTAPSTLNGTKSPTTPTSRSKIPIYTGANTNSIHSTSSFGKSRIPVAVGRHSSCSSSSTGTNLSLNLRSSSTSVSSKRRPSTDKSEI